MQGTGGKEIKKEGSQVTQGNQLADISNSSGIAGCDIRMVKKGESIKGRRCVVMFGYTPHRDDELELKPEDVIEIVQEVEEGWWEGHLNGRTAVFPSNFTRLVEEAFSSSSPPECSRGQQLNSEGQSKEVDCCAPYLVTSSMTEPKQDLLKPTKTTAIQETTKAPADGKAKAREFCKVLFPYEAQNEDELSIKEGDVVAIVSKECVDAGWWCGELGGQQGLFPDNFVKLLGCDRDKGRPKKPPPPDSSAAKPRSDTKLPLDAKKISPEQPESLPQRKEKKGEQLKPSADIRKPSVPPKKPLLLKMNKSLGQPAIGSPKPPQKPEQPLVTSIQSGGRHSMPEQGGLDRHIEVEDFDSIVTTSEKLNHPTASRPRVPDRRPPSQDFKHFTASRSDLCNASSYEEDTNNSEESAEQHSAAKNPSMGRKTSDIRLSLPPKPVVPPASWASGSNSNLEELQSQLRDLRGAVELMGKQHKKEIKQLMNELDEEKKIRLSLQMEVEHIKKVLSK